MIIAWFLWRARSIFDTYFSHLHAGFVTQRRCAWLYTFIWTGLIRRAWLYGLDCMGLIGRQYNLASPAGRLLSSALRACVLCECTPAGTPNCQERIRPRLWYYLHKVMWNPSYCITELCSPIYLNLRYVWRNYDELIQPIEDEPCMNWDSRQELLEATSAYDLQVYQKLNCTICTHQFFGQCLLTDRQCSQFWALTTFSFDLTVSGHQFVLSMTYIIQVHHWLLWLLLSSSRYAPFDYIMHLLRSISRR